MEREREREREGGEEGQAHAHESLVCMSVCPWSRGRISTLKASNKGRTGST